MGKRELGQLNVFDIIISFMISEIFSNAIAEPHSNIFLALLPILIIFIVQLLISLAVLHSKKIREFIESKPAIIIENGKINCNEMKKQRYNISDLLQQIHQQGIDDPSKINFAILENNGSLSIIEKSKSNLLYPYPLIADGKIDNIALEKTKWRKKDLQHKINSLNHDINDIFMAFVTVKGNLLIFSEKENNIY